MSTPPVSNEYVSPNHGTRAILRAGDIWVPSIVQETDCRTALTRGLAEYISQLYIDWNGGRQFAFRRVFDAWAEPEDEADYPSCAIYSDADGLYDASKFTSGDPGARVQLPSGEYLISSCEFVLDIQIDVWATDSVQRMGLVAMLERDLDPTDFRYGLLLELPHYFNERASFEKTSMRYIDNEDAAQRRIRRAQITVTGRVPVIRLASLPDMSARARANVVGVR